MIYNATARGLLHGVTQPEVCFLLERGAEANNIGLIGNAIETPITAACTTIADPNVTPDPRNANARRVPNGQGDGRFWRSRIGPAWRHQWQSLDTDFIKPSQVRNGNIIGIESGVTSVLTDMSRNTAFNTTAPSCFIIDFLPDITLQLIGGGSADFQRAQWMTLSTWGTPQGNAAADDVRLLEYNEWLYSLTDIGGASIDWEASGYFLPNEECYFEGCPPPFYPTPYTAEWTSGPTLISQGTSVTACDGSVIYDNPVGQKNGWSYRAGGTGPSTKFDLSSNTVAFSWNDALIVRKDSAGSFARPLCPVGVPETPPHWENGFGGGLWVANRVSGDTGSPQVWTGIYSWTAFQEVELPFTGEWADLDGVIDGVYLWFPGAPAA